MSKKARITGEVVYREGDGANIAIPSGPCEFEETAHDVTLSWVDGETRGLAAIPLTDFNRYLAEHAIELGA